MICFCDAEIVLVPERSRASDVPQSIEAAGPRDSVGFVGTTLEVHFPHWTTRADSEINDELNTWPRDASKVEFEAVRRSSSLGRIAVIGRPANVNATATSKLCCEIVTVGFVDEAKRSLIGDCIETS